MRPTEKKEREKGERRENRLTLTYYLISEKKEEKEERREGGREGMKVAYSLRKCNLHPTKDTS